MDIFSCLNLYFNDRRTETTNKFKSAILQACEQVHSDYVHTLTEHSVTRYYKYNGPNTFASTVKTLSKRSDLSAISTPLKALSQLYMGIGVHKYVGIIIQHDNTSIVIHNYGNTRHSMPLYCSINMSKVLQNAA